MNFILKYFTRFQEKLFSYTNIGIDVQKIQTVILVLLATIHAIYSIVFLLTFDFKNLLISGSLFVVLFYYAMSLNSVLQDSDNDE